jgi:hypothetical protein
MPSAPAQPTRSRCSAVSGAVANSETCRGATAERSRPSRGVYALVAITQVGALAEPRGVSTRTRGPSAIASTGVDSQSRTPASIARLRTARTYLPGCSTPPRSSR